MLKKKFNTHVVHKPCMHASKTPKCRKILLSTFGGRGSKIMFHHNQASLYITDSWSAIPTPEVRRSWGPGS